MFNIYRKTHVGSIDDRGGTMPFEVAALKVITEFISNSVNEGKPIKSTRVDPMHDVFEVVGPEGRAVSVRFGDSAYDDNGGRLAGHEAVMVEPEPA